MERTLSFALYALRIHVARKARVYVALLIVLVVAVFIWTQWFSAPSSFPVNHFVLVEEDVPVSVIAEDLREEGVIRMPVLFKLYMRIIGGDRQVHAGRYLFSEPLNLFEVAGRIRSGETGVKSVRITLPEGLAAYEMAEILARLLPDFDTKAWLSEAEPYEGYLFPDTYFIEPGTSPKEISERMRNNFLARTEGMALGADTVILASLLEKEADTPEDRRIVAGILLKRLQLGMRLQVDATFAYMRKIPGYVPTGEDPDMDSPYNTYRNAGLPPSAIGNPGLDALRAALSPTESSYLYYLTGHDGVMYYAKTFEEHKRNIELYL